MPVLVPPGQYLFQKTSQYVPQSHANLVSAREPTTYVVYQPSNLSPQANTNIQETVSNIHPITPRCSFRQLNRHMKPLTLKFPNNCQLGLNWLSDCSDLDSSQLSQSHPAPSQPLPITPCPSTPPPTEFLLNSAPSPSIGLSSLPLKNTPEPEKKPPLACYFCRGRKIACGEPINKTCKSVLPLSLFFSKL